MERLIRKTTAQQVADAIEVSILNGEFQPGEPLPTERTMSAQLGCSRITLREGISRLAGRGLLISIPGAGTFVSAMDVARSLDCAPSLYVTTKVPARRVELVRYLLDFRRALMAEALAMTCERASAQDLACVVEGLERMGSAARYSRDLEQAAEFELRVVHMAAEAGDARFFWLAITMVRDFYRVAQRDLLATLKLEDFARRADVMSQLVQKRDAAGLREWVRAHYLATDNRVIAELKARLNRPAPTATPPAPANADVETTVPGFPAFVVNQDVELPLEPPREDAPKTPEPPAPRPKPLVSASVPSGEPAESPAPADPLTPPPPEEAQSSASTDPTPEAGPPEEGPNVHDPLTLFDDLSAAPASDTGSEDDPFLTSWEGTPSLPRTDPRAWHSWFLQFYIRTFGIRPWQNPHEIPPGGFFDESPSDASDEVGKTAGSGGKKDDDPSSEGGSESGG